MEELQNIELLKLRMDIFEKYASYENYFSHTWLMESVLGFSKSETKEILNQKKN